MTEEDRVQTARLALAPRGSGIFHSTPKKIPLHLPLFTNTTPLEQGGMQKPTTLNTQAVEFSFDHHFDQHVFGC